MEKKNISKISDISKFDVEQQFELSKKRKQNRFNDNIIIVLLMILLVTISVILYFRLFHYGGKNGIS